MHRKSRKKGEEKSNSSRSSSNNNNKHIKLENTHNTKYEETKIHTHTVEKGVHYEKNKKR